MDDPSAETFEKQTMMNAIHGLLVKMRPLGSILVLGVCALGWVSCAEKAPERPPAPPSCRYTAASRVERANLPPKIYFFPPLLADAQGNPKEAMKPQLSAQGEIVEWVTPTERSQQILERLKKGSRKGGFQVVSFQEVLAMRRPHSILIVSCFYSAPSAAEATAKNSPDQRLLTMMKACTYDLDLDPRKSKNLAKVDGVSFFKADRKVDAIEAKSLEVLSAWLGENVTGMVYLEP